MQADGQFIRLRSGAGKDGFHNMGKLSGPSENCLEGGHAFSFPFRALTQSGSSLTAGVDDPW